MNDDKNSLADKIVGSTDGLGCAEKYCCCGCRWHIEDFHHCTTVAESGGCVCSQHKGWICMSPESERAHSGWGEHGMCEMWTVKQPNLK